MAVNPGITFIRSLYKDPVSQAKLLSLVKDGATGKLLEFELTGRTGNPNFTTDCDDIIQRHKLIRPLWALNIKTGAKIDFDSELMRVENLMSLTFTEILPGMIDKLGLSISKLHSISNFTLSQPLIDAPIMQSIPCLLTSAHERDLITGRDLMKHTRKHFNAKNINLEAGNFSRQLRSFLLGEVLVQQSHTDIALSRTLVRVCDSLSVSLDAVVKDLHLDPALINNISKTKIFKSRPLADIPVLHFLLQTVEMGLARNGLKSLQDACMTLIEMGENPANVNQSLASIFQGNFYKGGTSPGLRITMQRLCRAGNCNAEEVAQEFQNMTPAQILAEANRRAKMCGASAPSKQGFVSN